MVEKAVTGLLQSRRYHSGKTQTCSRNTYFPRRRVSLLTCCPWLCVNKRQIKLQGFVLASDTQTMPSVSTYQAHESVQASGSFTSCGCGIRGVHGRCAGTSRMQRESKICARRAICVRNEHTAKGSNSPFSLCMVFSC